MAGIGANCKYRSLYGLNKLLCAFGEICLLAILRIEGQSRIGLQKQAARLEDSFAPYLRTKPGDLVQAGTVRTADAHSLQVAVVPQALNDLVVEFDQIVGVESLERGRNVQQLFLFIFQNGFSVAAGQLLVAVQEEGIALAQWDIVLHSGQEVLLFDEQAIGLVAGRIEAVLRYALKGNKV